MFPNINIVINWRQCAVDAHKNKSKIFLKKKLLKDSKNKKKYIKNNTYFMNYFCSFLNRFFLWIKILIRK